MMSRLGCRGALICTVAGLLLSTAAFGQSRQPLFDGNPLETISRFGDRVVRSLRGEVPERRRPAVRTRARKTRQSPTAPSIGDVPLPVPRPGSIVPAEAEDRDEAAVAAKERDAEGTAATVDNPGVEEAADGQGAAGSVSGKAETAPDAGPPIPATKLPAIGEAIPTNPAADEAAAVPKDKGIQAQKTETAVSVEDLPAKKANGTGSDEPLSPNSGEVAKNTDAASRTAAPEAGDPDPSEDDAESGLDMMAGPGEDADPPLEGDEAETLPVAEIPLPDRRPAPPASLAPAQADEPNSPQKLRSRVPAVTPAAAVEAATAVEDAKACERELTSRGVIFRVGESIAEGECGVLRPVAIETLSSGVAVRPATTLLCHSALALDRWVSDSVEKAAEETFPGDKVVRFRHASTYVCRHRSSGPKISEHARGSAIDIAGFVFDSGRIIGVEKHDDGTPEAKFQKAIREGACGPFKTVLGPGTDADHATHFHLDIAARRNAYEYCR